MSDVATIFTGQAVETHHQMALGDNGVGLLVPPPGWGLLTEIMSLPGPTQSPKEGLSWVDMILLSLVCAACRAHLTPWLGISHWPW
jgi:hypothetical protein